MDRHVLGASTIIAILTVVHAAKVLPCLARNVNGQSIVCVCNSTYCDTVEPVSVTKGQVSVYTSSQAGLRFHKTSLNFTQKLNSTGVLFAIDRDEQFQTIIGFGGAFTDASGINIANLTPKTSDNLIQSYFGPHGIEYTLGRVPMASCDFSTREYSYDDIPNDFDLKAFTLAPEDMYNKIPYIKMAKKISHRNISLFASPWSSPSWMKTNHNMSGKGSLIGQPGGKYYKTWAQYFVKFLEEYAKYGINFWGITAQNEPTTGLLTNYSFQTLGFTAELQRDFIATDLGPALTRSAFKDIKLMILDDQRILLPGWAKTVLDSKEASQYVSGIGVHWYVDFLVPPFPLSETHKAFPDKFILATEACAGERFWDKPVVLGSWDRFERYVNDIIEDLSNWVVGWTDWNLALDLEGGPNWVSNFVDSPIIVNATNDEFYKQPTFYAMGHFSKFLPQGSTRVGVRVKGQTQLKFLTFVAQDKSVISVIYNSLSVPQKYQISDKEGYIHGVIPAKSIQTLVWKS